MALPSMNSASETLLLIASAELGIVSAILCAMPDPAFQRGQAREVVDGAA
jgi:hypothetical protein